MERTWRPSPVSRWVREALLEERCRRRDDRLRVARRARAAALWVEGAPQRVVLAAAAGLLDQEDEHLLADWLLRARPEHTVTVATGVAVHALMRGYAAAFDTLMEAGLVNDAVFMDAFFGVSREFVWGPPLSHLAP